jgi:hypothetical protein
MIYYNTFFGDLKMNWIKFTSGTYVSYRKGKKGRSLMYIARIQDREVFVQREDLFRSNIAWDIDKTSFPFHTTREYLPGWKLYSGLRLYGEELKITPPPEVIDYDSQFIKDTLQKNNQRTFEINEEKLKKLMSEYRVSKKVSLTWGTIGYHALFYKIIKNRIARELIVEDIAKFMSDNANKFNRR